MKKPNQTYQGNVTPLVSIIIPNYNYGTFLHAAVESVVEQTYKRLELNIIDDGSSDDSRQDIKSRKGFCQGRVEKFKSLLMMENRGILHAINNCHFGR